MIFQQPICLRVFFVTGLDSLHSRRASFHKPLVHDTSQVRQQLERIATLLEDGFRRNEERRIVRHASFSLDQLVGGFHLNVVVEGTKEPLLFRIP